MLSDRILIVDDNDDDIFALRRALRKAAIGNPQEIARNGQEAVEYLGGTGAFTDRQKFPLPFLVFLDLKMPFRDGFEVLSWIRERPELADIVVVVLTGSDEARDHQRAYALGARSYLVKPPSREDLEALVASMDSYWMRTGSKSPVVT